MNDGVFLGVDIGRSGHYALAVDAAGTVIHQTAVANDEAVLQKLVDWAKAHQATVVVDQPGGAAALLLRVCWQAEIRIGYLHGLAMARARDFCAGESKTDPKDAFVLADVARAHHRRVVWLEPTGEALAHLERLSGYDADLRADANRLTNRLRALLATHWPALERAFGERLARRGVLPVLQQFPSGPAIKEAGVEQLTAALKAQRVRRPEALAKHLHQAALAQTVTITGSATASRLIGELAVQLAVVLAGRDDLEHEIEQAFYALPEAAILRSLPGVGPRLEARMAVEIGSISRFRTPAYAGLGPTPWKSGTSISANLPSRFGNHRLKNALFLAAFANGTSRRGSTTTASALKASATTRRCRASLGAASTCYTRCSTKACPTEHRPYCQQPLDKEDRNAPTRWSRVTRRRPRARGRARGGRRSSFGRRRPERCYRQSGRCSRLRRARPTWPLRRPRTCGPRLIGRCGARAPSLRDAGLPGARRVYSPSHRNT
jgi:transposase